MAQRIVHYLLAAKLADTCPVTDRQRFLTGSLLPDAYVSVSDRKLTHYKTIRGDEHMFDFNRFRSEFRDRIFFDDLYLGYYLHLIEDALYRRFFWINGYERPLNMEETKYLHNDYHILNSVLIEKHGLVNELTVPLPLEEEPVSAIAPLSAEMMITELANDFSDTAAGPFRYVDEAMIETYIRETLPVCLRETEAVRSGTFVLDARDFRYCRECAPKTAFSAGK